MILARKDIQYLGVRSRYRDLCRRTQIEACPSIPRSGPELQSDFIRQRNSVRTQSQTLANERQLGRERTFWPCSTAAVCGSRRLPTSIRTNCATNPSHFDKADCMLPALARSRLAVSGIFAVCFLLCSGCAFHSNNPLPRQSVQIVSQPPGARIEINGRYAGDAPTTVEIESSPHGRFWKDTIIKAYPKTGYIQIKAFNGESRWPISDPIPSRISFDTRIDPTAGLNETQGR
jgi:hypothetical protein